MSIFNDINTNDLFCRNLKCEDHLQKNRGNIQIKEYKGLHKNAMYICKTCGKCFSVTNGTPFFKLKNSIDEIAKVLSLIPKLGSIRAVARYTNHKPDTIINWIAQLEENRDEIDEYFLKFYHYSQNQINELWNIIERRKRKKV